MAIFIPVVPAPMIAPYCKKVNSISLKKLGAYSTNPLKLTLKGPLSNISVKDGDILEEVEQIDTTVFQVDIIDENGFTNKYTLIVPDPN